MGETGALLEVSSVDDDCSILWVVNDEDEDDGTIAKLAAGVADKKAASAVAAMRRAPLMKFILVLLNKDRLLISELLTRGKEEKLRGQG